MRKSPIRHHVRSYKRGGKIVHNYVRGKGDRPAKAHLGLKNSLDTQEKIKNLVLHHTFIDVKENQIKQLFTHQGHPVAIVDTWQFGGIWNPNNKLIMVDSKTWSRLTEKQKKIVLEHEIIERQFAMPNYKTYRSHSDAVSKNHDKTNAVLFKKYGREEVISALGGKIN